MQNNITEITQRLLRSLDNNYNVIDIPAVIEIISILEKVAITKELLETTRLGKYVNELRRKTNNDSLSKRAKELLKKWKSMVLPETNGQLKQVTPLEQEDVNLNQLKSKKRPAKDPIVNIPAKRVKINGQISEFELSDNSNSSFKDVINANTKLESKVGVILINSDSNSSLPDGKQDPPLEQQLPKKRGRKKGSKNHKNLLDEAETSFTSKLAVSRGNSKVKTTQELIASLQNKNSISTLNLPLNSKPKEDLNERAAKLTERVSIIDQTLYTNSNRYKHTSRKNSLQKHGLNERNDRVIESGSVINDRSLVNSQANSSNTDEEIIVVDDIDNVSEDILPESEEKPETEEVVNIENTNFTPSLSVEEALTQLPPIDLSILEDTDEEPKCTCFLKENKTDFSIEDEQADSERFEFVEDQHCLAKSYIEDKYHLGCVSEQKVRQLSSSFIPNVNGNMSVGPAKGEVQIDDNCLYINVVPNISNECILKDEKGEFSSENFKKYSISESDTSGKEIEDRTGDNNKPGNSDNNFCEWHEVVETSSYNGEILKILPYVIID